MSDKETSAQAHPRVSVVAFDYGGVLTGPVGPGMRQLADSAGADTAELGKLILGDYGEDHGPLQRLERGQMTLAEFADWGRAAGLERGWRLELGNMLEWVAGLPVQEAMVAYIGGLRGRGYRTALITNTAHEFCGIWRKQLSVDDLFDAVAASCELGARKPDPRIFELTLGMLGEPDAAEVLFVDDMSENVAGARQVGMEAILADEDSEVTISRIEDFLAGQGR